LVVPLGIYYAVTLAVPLLNGSYKQGAAFWEHFAFVLLLPLFIILCFLVAHLAYRLSYTYDTNEHSEIFSAARNCAVCVDPARANKAG
jgi:hypothetical protein